MERERTICNIFKQGKTFPTHRGNTRLAELPAELCSTLAVYSAGLRVKSRGPGSYSDRHVPRFSLVVLGNARRVRQVWSMDVKLSSARDEGIRGSEGTAPFILVGIMWRRLRSTSFAIHTSLIAPLFITVFPEL